jgi:hypothetical protein
VQRGIIREIDGRALSFCGTGAMNDAGPPGARLVRCGFCAEVVVRTLRQAGNGVSADGSPSAGGVFVIIAAPRDTPVHPPGSIVIY